MRKEPDARAGRPTVLAESAWFIVAVCVGCGAVLGELVRLLAGWLVTLRWAPFKGPAKLLESIPEPGLTIGAVSAGALLGLLVAFGALHDSLSVSVSDSHVVLTVRDTSREFARNEIRLAFPDGKQLVLLGRDSEELAREDCDLNGARLAAAFTEHGYTWADADPHRDEFRRWVPGTPGLPEGANALFKARDKALNKQDDAEDARELRGELAKLGVVVRDEKKRQYWRMPRRS
ncbi:hypothetical protein FGD71_041640 [Streptomyces sporangiiformans]|uniref:DUF308 domain-containing protein n=2 Tax=Streptomyces sporangiiformans TaxID=2315329 RepID=A0A505D145_9ACTN|nr:hypothetical protein FGD71_041640 [Streptomyces sporangiiformans]